MKTWGLTSNVDDMIEQYGFKLFDRYRDQRQYDAFLTDYATIHIGNGGALKIYCNGEEKELADAFWPMMTNTDSFCLEHLLNEAGCKSIVNLNEVAVARSKIATYQRLAQNHVRIPETVVFFNHPDKQAILEQFSYPFVVKPDNGFGGDGVELIQNEEQFDTYLSNLQYGIAYMAQEYISSSRGRDLRIICVNGECVYSIIRQAGDPKEFRSNVHTGGSMTPYEPEDKTKELCRYISSLFDLQLIGIDLLFGDGEYVVTEINAAPGSSSQFIAPLIDRYIEEHGDNQ